MSLMPQDPWGLCEYQVGFCPCTPSHSWTLLVSLPQISVLTLLPDPRGYFTLGPKAKTFAQPGLFCLPVYLFPVISLLSLPHLS